MSVLEIILRGARQVGKGIKLLSGERLQPQSGNIDDMTVIHQTVPSEQGSSIASTAHMGKKDQGREIKKSLDKEWGDKR